MKLLINIITFSRIIAGPLLFMLLNYSNQFGLIFLLFFWAAISDFFDGFLARKYKATSQLGEILDPIADKILILFLLFGLTLKFESFYIGLIGSSILTREFWIAALRDLKYEKRKDWFTPDYD